MEQSNMNNLTIGIIGYGRFGKVIADNIFPDNKKNISSRSLRPRRSVEEVVKNSDIIIPAVPINQFENILKEISKHITQGKTVLDVCSVKKYPVEGMENNLPKNINIIATHPMFGPSGIEKQNGKLNDFTVVMSNIRSDATLYEDIKKHFNKLGLITVEMSPDEHDKLQAETQYLAQKIKFTFSNMQIAEPSVIDTPAVKSIKDAFKLMQTSRELLQDMEEYNPYCLPLFKKFMKASTTTQKTIYYLGPEGSFNHVLITKLFSDGYHLHMCNSFEEVMEQTKNNAGSIGALGIENSISSDVHQNIDLMFNERLHIIGEASLKITMNLIALKGTKIAEIKEIYSHPQALLQCSKFIKNHNLTGHQTESTSQGKDIVLNEKSRSKAVIGSSALVDNQCDIIAEDIANTAHNLTRFIFISTKDQQLEELGLNKNKVTYIFQVKHEPGTLATLLSDLAKEKLNLTKIQSRPIPGTDWEYDFWIDMETPYTSQNKINEILEKHTTTYVLLGTYEKGKIFNS